MLPNYRESSLLWWEPTLQYPVKGNIAFSRFSSRVSVVVSTNFLRLLGLSFRSAKLSDRSAPPKYLGSSSRKRPSRNPSPYCAGEDDFERVSFETRTVDAFLPVISARPDTMRAGVTYSVATRMRFPEGAHCLSAPLASLPWRR